MDNDILTLYENLIAFETPKSLRKAHRSLLEAGEDGLLSDGYFALNRPYKDLLSEVKALRRAKKKHLGEARIIFGKDPETLSEDELAAGFIYLELIVALANDYCLLGEREKAKKELLSAVELTDGLSARTAEALGAIYLAEGNRQAFRELRRKAPEAHGLKLLNAFFLFIKDEDAVKLRRRLVRENFYAYLTVFGVCHFQEGLLVYAERHDDGSDRSLPEMSRLFAYLRAAGFDLNAFFLKVQSLAPNERERFLSDRTNEAALSLLASRFRLGGGGYIKKKEALAYLVAKEGLDEKKARKVIRSYLRSGLFVLKDGYLVPTPGAFAVYMVP